MRYYLYVSRGKLDMLFEQIPRKLLSKVAAEAKVDLKVLSASVQKTPTDAGLYDRLDVVEKYLDREYDISWATDPAPWFRGDLGLRIAEYADGPPGPVFMMGEAGGTVVVLIGSAHHLVGRQPGLEATVSHSFPYSVLRLLQQIPEEWQPGAPIPGVNGSRLSDDEEPLHLLLHFSKSMTKTATYCEFLARRLMHGRVTGRDGIEKEIVVGTPLYVALADEEPEGEH
ncbi:DUF7019 family protein [Streptomyces sp. NPDC050658]|uniref:DUF7019 family protein n=1 Tax=unclassified Streptomyces TaxID=2593676 RepID=UPI00342016DD